MGRFCVPRTFQKPFTLGKLHDLSFQNGNIMQTVMLRPVFSFDARTAIGENGMAEYRLLFFGIREGFPISSEMSDRDSGRPEGGADR